MTTCWELVLPWGRPPLTMNQRLHHMARYSLEQEVQRAVWALAKQQKIPTLERVTIELSWGKGDNRTADPDNIAATLKPAIDGLKLAGVLPDDNAQHVAWTKTRITLARDRQLQAPILVLRITDASADRSPLTSDDLV